jgi:hypothetical protein
MLKFTDLNKKDKSKEASHEDVEREEADKRLVELHKQAMVANTENDDAGQD